MDHGHFPDFSYGLVKWLNQFALDNPKYNYINISYIVLFSYIIYPRISLSISHHIPLFPHLMVGFIPLSFVDAIGGRLHLSAT